MDYTAACCAVTDQDRCQKKVFNRGLYVCAEGLDILNFTKKTSIYSTSYFNFGAWSFVWGLGTVTDQCEYKRHELGAVHVLCELLHEVQIYGC